MDDKTEVIRHNIEETRSSLTDKLETLQESVVGTVQNTTSAVTGTVDSVKEAVQETVGAVKDTVASTVETVKGTVRDTVEAVRSSLDVSQHVRNYPWAMLGGSVAAGYLAGIFLTPPKSTNGHAGPFEEPHRDGESNGRSWSNASQREPAMPRSASESTAAQQKGGAVWRLVSGELDKIRKIAIGTAAGIVREMIEQNMSGDLAQHLTHVVNDVNEKLGGETIRGPFMKGQADGQQWSPSDAEMAAGTA